MVEEKIIKYDLACGNYKESKDFIGVDVHKTDCVDVIFDLDTYPWTFAEDNSVDEIRCSHFVEHVKDIVAFMNECGRILKPGGKMTIIAPYYSSVRCWQDPTHIRAISEGTFLYYNKAWRERENIGNYLPITCDFEFTIGYNLEPDWVNRNEAARTFALKHYINVVSDLQVVLIKK